MANIQNSPNYNKLKNVLKEVFQLDQADLDFGIYRIMNQKRNEIDDFLENRLLPQVTEILQSSGDGSNSKVQQELDKAIEQANSLGVDPDTLPKVIELRSKLSSTTSVDSLEQEVYSHLANFFKRYYKDGDFVSLRRYKKDVYAIPYEGEEVKLHWANHDQYYIKTSEYLKNYGFKLSNGKSVKFELKEASTEQNNNKEQTGKERRFQLFSEFPFEVSEDGTTMIVNFSYEEHDKKVKQNKLIEEALGILISSIPQDFHAVLEKRPTDKNKNRTLLEKHILDFTARNSFDYFIHKDLGGFLSRELDFYIKNEVLYLDDINTDNEGDFTAQISKVKAVKQVAQKIITFLSQLENFQKKLWLKKKFVISTNYCITLDKIPEKYYEEIAKNKEQLEEWKELFKIDKIEDDLFSVKYSEPVSTEFLKSQPYLLLDTKFFDDSFKSDLLSEFDNLDEQTNGVLVNSENFQAINLLNERFKSKVGCIHIDPPYNTATSGFLYKNNFQHSSWATMMDNRLSACYELLADNGTFLTHIDENEYENLFQLFNNYSYNNLGTIIWDKRNPMNGGSGIATQHEYILSFSRGNTLINKRNKSLLSMLAKVKSLIKSEGGIVNESVRSKYRSWLNSNKELSGGETAYRHIDDNGNIYRGISLRAPEPRANEKFHTPLIHPKTGKPCAMPPNGFSRTPETLKEMMDNDEILFGSDETSQPQQKKILTVDSQRQMSSMIQDAKKGKSYTDNLGVNFPYCHPVSLYDELLGSSFVDPKFYTIDFFAGSGTSGHSIISLNREDGENRKYIMVEMGEYFESVTKPRILKVIYSENWKKGVPQELSGISQIVRYHDFESYEDVLNNLSLIQNKAQSNLMDSSDFKDTYLLSYMLDVESRDNLLNLDAFRNPFNYRLNITRKNESQETVIDLVETFNYLIGLHVKTIQSIKGFKVITGVTNERDEETLIIWRNTEEKSNQDLNTFFTKADFSTRDSEFQRIYVNGDNHLENLKTGDDNWKVVLIEEEFMKRMFDVQDV
jgi:adenine-specific DNA-methyltransferase